MSTIVIPPPKPTPGGGGADLGALVLETVDLSTGWQLVDSGGLIKSVVFDSGTGENTITFNALGSGNAVYNWKNSSTKSGPRWFRDAAIGGTSLVRTDSFTGLFLLDVNDTVRDAKLDFICGVARDANQTLVSNILFGGAICSLFSTSVPSNASYGVYSYSAATSAGTSGPDKGLITMLFGAEKVGGGVSYPLNASGLATNISTRSSSQSLTGGTSLHQVVAVGAYSNTSTIPQDAVLKITCRYAFIKPVI